MRDEGFGLKGAKSHFGFILPVEILRELDLQLVLHTPYDLTYTTKHKPRKKSTGINRRWKSLLKSTYMHG